MTAIHDILTIEHTLCQAKAGSSKKRVLEFISDFITDSTAGIDSSTIFENLVAREKLGSTGLGKGVAIPHCRCEDINDIQCYLISLDNPVDFDAADNHPVDILFVLIVPTDAHDQHLQTLASIAELFDQTEFRNRIRKCKTAEELFDTATNYAQAA